MNIDSQARRRLVEVAKSLSKENRDWLEESKAGQAQLERPDFIWHFLLQSFATMGNVMGWELIGNRANYEKVTFDALSQLAPQDRLSTPEQTLRDAKVRWPAKKAKWLDRNYKRIEKMGGLVAAKAALFGRPGREEKIKFLMSFTGIGPKYARNLMMDAYHPDFRDSIAIDTRIAGLSKELDLSFDSYEEHEKFYLDIAHAAGVSGWELDRLFFNFRDEIIRRLRQT